MPIDFGNYDKYGISESYIPKIYFNKIVLEHIRAAKPNSNLTQDPYIKEKSGYAGAEPASTDAQTKVTVHSNIIFNVPSFSDFKALVQDEDFSKSFIMYYGFFWKNPSIALDTKIGKDGKKIDSPLKEAVINNPHIKSTVLKNTTDYVWWGRNMSHILNKLKDDTEPSSLNISEFDVLKKYEKLFPNGSVYYQVPFKVTLIVSKENISNLYCIGFGKVIDYPLNLNLNFGNFNINDDDLTINAFDAMGLSVNTNAVLGPITMETILEKKKAPKTAVLYTISNNQSTITTNAPLKKEYKLFTSGGVNKIVEYDKITNTVMEKNPFKKDLERENLFNDYKGMPWLGSVHKNPYTGRWMAGLAHTKTEVHPFLDANYAPNTKLIDLRSLKKLQDAKFDISNNIGKLKQYTAQPLKNSAEGTATGKVLMQNYSQSTTEKQGLGYQKVKIIPNEIEKLNVISDPLLSCMSGNEGGDIAGTFGINYTRFLRKHSVLGSLLEHLAAPNIAQVDDWTGFKETFFGTLNMKDVLGRSLHMQVTRIGSEGSSVIYDSSGADEDGVFREKKWSGGDLIPIRDLGYLTPINIPKRLYDFDSLENITFVEFYSFVDLDSKKLDGVDYRYKIKATFTDPMFAYLSSCLNLLNKAIDGNGKVIGLKQLLSLIEATGGMDHSLKQQTATTANLNIFPYIKEKHLLVPNQQQAYKGSMIKDLIKDYEARTGVKSLTTPAGTASPRLIVVNNLFGDSAGIITVLANSQTNPENAIPSSALIDTVDSIMNFNDMDNLSYNLIQYLMTVIDSVRINLTKLIDSVSNINYTKSSDAIGKNALASSKASLNANKSLRRITEEKTSETYIRKTDYGFDYTSIFKDPAAAAQKGGASTGHGTGLKQIPFGVYKNTIFDKIVSKYFVAGFGGGPGVPVGIPIDAPDSVKDADNWLREYGISSLTLSKGGIQIGPRPAEPDQPDFNHKEWAAILQTLLLFKKGNLMRMDKQTAFAFNQFKAVNKVSGLEFYAQKLQEDADISTENLNILKSVEKNQVTLAYKGLAVQDPVTITDGVVYIENKQTGQDEKIITTGTVSKTDPVTEYFLSYVNNYAQTIKTPLDESNGIFSVFDMLSLSELLSQEGTGAGKAYAKTNEDTGIQAEPNATIPLVSMRIYADDEKSQFLGEPVPGISYDGYYDLTSPEANITKSKFVWAEMSKEPLGLPGADNQTIHQLILSNYAEYFFEFIRTIRVEYLSGFEKYDYVTLNQKSTFEAKDNIHLNSYQWSPMNLSVMNQVDPNQMLICRLVNSHSPAFKGNKLAKELDFYPLFYKYFLIINKDSWEEIPKKPFGSTL